MSDPYEPFREEATALVDSLLRYLKESHRGEAPVISQPPMSQLASTLELERWMEDGGLTGQHLARFFDVYLHHTTRLHHPGFMAHQVATPDIRASLGHLVDGFTNNGMNIYEMGPPAATIEYAVINWMLALVGWPTRPWPDASPLPPGCAGGALTHGGSLANLTALLTARAAAFPNVWEQGYQQQPVILAPACNHYSIKRAAGMMGLGTQAVLHLPTDEQDRIIPEGIAQVYQDAVAQGKTPFALVANACSTAIGAYDDLQRIGPICKELGLWFHVDGAHGAGALVSPKHRHLLQGLELADSLIWDAHKMFATPALCAAVLVRDARHLDHTFQQEASYLFHEKDEPGFDFMPRTLECTKAGMGLRFFTILASLGRKGLAEHVERLCQLGQIAWQMLQERPGFSTPTQPQSNIVCFRYGDDDATQLALRTALTRQGDFYITTTLFRGKRYLRLALMNPRTTRDVLENMLDAIEAAAKKTL